MDVDVDVVVVVVAGAAGVGEDVLGDDDPDEGLDSDVGAAAGDDEPSEGAGARLSLR